MISGLLDTLLLNILCFMSLNIFKLLLDTMLLNIYACNEPGFAC